MQLLFLVEEEERRRRRNFSGFVLMTSSGNSGHTKSERVCCMCGRSDLRVVKEGGAPRRQELLLLCSPLGNAARGGAEVWLWIGAESQGEEPQVEEFPGPRVEVQGF